MSLPATFFTQCSGQAKYSILLIKPYTPFLYHPKIVKKKKVLKVKVLQVIDTICFLPGDKRNTKQFCTHHLNFFILSEIIHE